MAVRHISNARGLSRPSGLALALVLSGCAAGAVFVLAGTLRYGPAVTPDSAMYVAAANSLLEGEGYTGYYGEPYTEKPPLYPTILALGRLAGLEPIETAPLLNALTLCLLVFLTGWILLSALEARRFAWIGFLAVLFSWPLLQVAVKVWSEPVFILICMLFVTYAPASLKRPDWSRIMILAGLAALATMQRYIGLSLVIVGVAMILFMMPETSLRSRVRYAAGFFVAAVSPLVFWIGRNYALDSTLTGNRTVSTQLLTVESVSGLVETVTTWIVPPVFPVWTGVAVCIVLIAVVTVGFRRLARSGDGESVTLYRVMGLFAVVYAVSVTCLAMLEAAALPDNRILSPLYIPVVYLVLAGLDGLTRGPRYRRELTGLRRLVAGVCAVWLLYPVATTAGYVSIRAIYDTNVWNGSALAASLKTNPPEGALFSNQAWVVYLSTGRHTRRYPAEKDDFEACPARDWENDRRRCMLAWFYGTDRGRSHASNILREFFSRCVQGETWAGGLVNTVLELMTRSGLASKKEPPGPSEVSAFAPEQTAIERSPITNVQVVRSFEDGALYLLPG